MAHLEESGKTAQSQKHSTIRIFTLGTFHIEWEQQPFLEERLTGRGAAPALGLLKALLTRADRFALRDWLMEQFWPDSASSKADERLDDVASGLRTLLRPPGSTAKILHFVYGSNGKGSGYRLEGYPFIWVDADAFEWYIEQAARLDRFGHDSLSLWEQACQLASRGAFLPEEQYSDWALARRERLEGHYRQCVHRLVHLLREMGAYEEALLRLRTYWQQYQTDEDALRVLLEMLGERERYQEAEQYYRQTREMLEHEGREPDPRTQDVMEIVRIKPIQRSPNKIRSTALYVPSPIFLPKHKQALAHTENSDPPLHERNIALSLEQIPNSPLRGIIDRNFSKELTYDLLSSNVKTMNFRDEWQYIVNNVVSETKAGLRAMVFDVELTRWWNTRAGQLYMITNMELLKRKIPVKRIFILSSLDTRIRMNTLVNAYVHHKIGIDVRICSKGTDFQDNIPFKPNMFSVHDDFFVTLYYLSFDKPITNLLLERKSISEFRSFYDELFADDSICTDIESVLAQSNLETSFVASIQTQLELLQHLDKIGSVTDLVRKGWQ